MLTALTERDFLIRYVADGVAYIQITKFSQHQRPKKDETVSRIPTPLLEHPRGIGAAGRVGDGQGDRGQGDRETGRGSADGAASAVDFQHAWNDLTQPPIPRCRELSAKRQRQCRTRATERPLSEWREVFARIQASAFCRGENDRGWVATFDWAIGSPDVAVKVLEGKYDTRSSSPTLVRPAVDGAADVWRRMVAAAKDEGARLDRVWTEPVSVAWDGTTLTVVLPPASYDRVTAAHAALETALCDESAAAVLHLHAESTS